jgi:PAS domain S-box-containing protein
MKTKESAELGSVFCGDSQMAAALRARDWHNSALGPVEQWPMALRNSIRIVLASAYPMFVWWGEEMIMFYNDAYIPVLGPKHPDAIGRPGKEKWSEIWHVIGPLMEQVLRKGETCFREKDLLFMERNCCKEETYYTYSYSPVINEDGSVGGIFCACQEETAQVLSERRLKSISKISGIRTDTSVEAARIEVLQVLSENTNDIPFAILYRIEDGDIVLDNYTKAAFSLSPEEEKELLALPVFPGSERMCAGIQTISIPSRLKNLMKMPAHGVLPEQAVVIPIKEIGQNLVRGYFIMGISAVLPFNEDYLKFLELLSSQINITVTNVRAFEQERRLTQRLLELDKAKTDFFSNVSHEFRTPLTLILGPLEFLLSKSESFSEDDRSSLKIMHRNGLRLLKQVNTLLNFSFVEAGRYKARFAPTDLARVTRDLSGTFQSALKQAGLEYRVACKPLSERVYVDAEMWEMIVLNLLSNAYKFTLSGSIELELLDKEMEVELHVTDTGVGIPREELPYLFERFHRIEHEAGRTFEGSGIGLALVSELVKLHGGGIQVVSEVGKGSRFVISLLKGSSHLPQDQVQYEPADDSHSFDMKRLHESEAESWLASHSGLKTSTEITTAIAAHTDQSHLPTVLLVDDNPDMLRYVVRLLEKEYHVVTAVNGQDALEILQYRKPDLILSDVMMPVMDGVTLLNEVRSLPELVSVPVILLSARAGEEDRFLGFNTGADDYLVKPFIANELLTRIRSNIRNAKLRSEWKEKEQKLLADTAERKELLESILNSISDSFYHIDSQMEFIYVNNRALEVADKKREDHIGKKVLDVYPYLAGTRVYQTITEAVETLRPATLEYYDEKLERWFDCRLYPTSQGTTGYFADITARKMEEQARAEMENRFREMADAAPVLIWMSGTDMLCYFFNNSWLAFRGRTQEEEFGNGWVEGVHPDDVEFCMETYTSAFKEGKPFSMEYRLLNKDGEYRWVLDNGVPRLTSEGLLLGYIGACTDITERKWAESLLDNYNQELVEQVALRTRELLKANEQLKIEIEEKNRSKSELIRSHKQLQSLTSYLQDLRENERKLIAREIHDELGQALTALKIEISLLYDRLAESRSKYKTDMLENLGSMEQALDESLASLRRIITELRPSMSDDLELVYEIQRLVTGLGSRLGISIAVKSEVEKIELEPTIAIEVYRVIQESLTNTIKHAHASSVLIEISQVSDKFRFLVVDNGVGFDEEVLAGKKSFGILGIKERAQRIGAQLAISSCPGKGTRVELLVDTTLRKRN